MGLFSVITGLSREAILPNLGTGVVDNKRKSKSHERFHQSRLMLRQEQGRKQRKSSRSRV